MGPRRWEVIKIHALGSRETIPDLSHEFLCGWSLVVLILPVCALPAGNR